ncbi:MAG: 3-deoxy-manno-octulosonate cytidylyltransferase [bacterium]|nr:3-deoxy-manno-octulosonate cytidylyltransferase [bacterium]
MAAGPGEVIAVIPARWASTRFPGKPLADIAGRPMIEHVYRKASQARLISRVIVATDDERIFETVRAFGGEVQMTRADHPSGTDRVAEVAAGPCGEGAIAIVNVQGDEPLIEPKSIDGAVAPFLAENPPDMSTLAVPLAGPEAFLDPNVVKVVVAASGDALYFSRAPIPFARDRLGSEQARAEALADGWETLSPRPLKHLGLYAYRRDYLFRLAKLPPTRLEQAEKLEQLRALENGASIRVIVVEEDSIGVDVPEDLVRLQSNRALYAALEEEVRRWPSTSS